MIHDLKVTRNMKIYSKKKLLTLGIFVSENGKPIEIKDMTNSHLSSAYRKSRCVEFKNEIEKRKTLKIRRSR